MRKKIFNILFITIFAILILGTKVNASNIVSTDKKVNSGDGNVTISLTSKQPLGAYNIELVDDAGLELVSSNASSSGTANGKKISGASATGVTDLGSYTFKVPTVNTDTTYKIKFRITGMADVNDEDLPNVDNNAILTVSAPKVETPPDSNNTSNTSSSGNSTTNNNTSTTKSSEARLRDLGLNPKEYDFKGFKTDTYEYDIEVPNEAEKVYIYATTKDSSAKVKSGEGNVTLNEGENKIEVVVVAEDGKTKKTYTLNITRKVAEKIEQPTEGEDPNQENEVPEEPTEVVEKKLGLISLSVNNLKLNETFNTDVYEYSANLEEDLNYLNVIAIANYEDAVIDIIGNDDLSNGNNIIKINVRNFATSENIVYTIRVNKKIVKNENDTTTVTVNADWLDPETWQTKQYVIIGIIAVLVLIIVIAIIIKIRLSRQEEEEIELPGGEELDKAILEHQEISSQEYEESESKIHKDEMRKEALNEYFAGYRTENKTKGKHF